MRAAVVVSLTLSPWVDLPPAHAAGGTTITVNTAEFLSADNGNCDIREALEAASSNAAVDNCPAGVASPA